MRMRDSKKLKIAMTAWDKAKRKAKGEKEWKKKTTLDRQHGGRLLNLEYYNITVI